MIYLVMSGPQQTTAAFASLATGTGLKTLLQVKMGATVVGKIKEWGVSFNALTAAIPGKVELIETDVAATVAAHVAAGIRKIDGPALLSGDPTTALFAVGTTSTGYDASGEGSIAAARDLDAPQFISPTNQFIKQVPLGGEAIIQLTKFARIRVHMSADVGAIAYMLIEV